jgi:prolyl-tRNA synthetase
LGLSWPVTVAPYAVHMVLLVGKNKSAGPDTRQVADELYNRLQSTGVETLLDDRDESPGVKFNDADLIGNPLRVTVSERALAAGGVEYKRRDQAEKAILPLEQITTRIVEDIGSMEAEIKRACVEVPYQ